MGNNRYEVNNFVRDIHTSVGLQTTKDSVTKGMGQKQWTMTNLHVEAVGEYGMSSGFNTNKLRSTQYQSGIPAKTTKSGFMTRRNMQQFHTTSRETSIEKEGTAKSFFTQNNTAS